MNRLIAAAVFLAAPVVSADEVFLRGGGSVHGEVVERTAESIVMEVGPGRMTLPLRRVDHIVETTSALALYRSRASALAAGDVEGWVRLARWADSHDLLTQARLAYEHVLTLDPQNAAANGAVGHVRLGGEWVTAEDSYRARGYVPFEGTWVTPEERGATLALRAADAQAAQVTAEAAARAREAEARAAAAEADARRAEAEAAQGGSGWSGSDWGYGAGYGAGYGPVYGGGYGSRYGNGVRVVVGAVHPYAATPYGYGGPYGGVYGPYGLRHAGSPGVGGPGQPVVTPHGSGTSPARDGGGSRGPATGRRH
jgi:hypothetical protein